MPKQGVKIHIFVQKINQPNFKYLNQNHKEEDFIAIGFFLHCRTSWKDANRKINPKRLKVWSQQIHLYMHETHPLSQLDFPFSST